jgi:hypothetical protein
LIAGDENDAAGGVPRSRVGLPGINKVAAQAGSRVSGCLTAPKWRFAKARPEPVFRYFSQRAAADSFGNSSDTTMDQGPVLSCVTARPVVVPLESVVHGVRDDFRNWLTTAAS